MGYLIGGIIAIAAVIAVLWLAYGIVAILAINVLAAGDTLFAASRVVPPYVSWAIMGFVFGTIVHFAIIESHKLSRPAVKPTLLWIGCLVLAVTLVGGELTPTYRNRLSQQVVPPYRQPPAASTVPASAPEPTHAPVAPPVSTPQETNVLPVPAPEISRFAFMDQTVLDRDTQLCWTRDANLDHRKMTWYDANNLIDRLNRERYDGHSNWRLPNKSELREFALAAHKGAPQDKTTDALKKIGFNDVQAGYWSSDEGEDGMAIVLMNRAEVRSLKKTFECYVWPVR